MGFLRDLFGPSRKEIWGQLAAQLDGRYVDGGFFGRDKVELTCGQWTFTLDTYTVSSGKNSTTYTRMRAPYVNPDNFSFCIYRESIFSPLGRLFGMQDIKVGFPEFDDAFVVKANNERRVTELLSHSSIRHLFAGQPRIRLEVRDDEGWFGTRFPDGVDELRFEAVGVIRDLRQLRSLYDLFAEVLHQLCAMGSAYEDDPNVAL